MTIQHLYPTTRPSLDLNFARTKRLDPKVTFTRGSTATYVGSDGLIKTAASNTARFDHDPVTGESLGLLVEEARTNYKTISTTLNPSFVFTNTISPAPSATIVAPDGVSQTVEKLVEDTSTGTHNGVLQFSGVYDNWATSFFVKAAGRTRFKFDPQENGSFTEFDLTSGTVNGVVDSSRFEQLPNGWFRVKNFTVSSFRAYSRWRLLDASGNESYTGDGVSGIYLWGFQWERPATFSSSYIPTSGSTVTRAADVASMTGTNFSSWWSASTGTFQANFRAKLSGTRPVLSVDDNTANNRIELYTSTSSQKFTVTTSGAAQADITAGTASSTAINSQSAVYGSNDFSTSLNGAAAVTDTSGTVPVVTQLRIGANQAGNTTAVPIARLTYYPTRLTNAQLQALTL